MTPVTSGARLSDGVVVESHHKGFPSWAVGRPIGKLRGIGLTGDGFLTPVLLLDDVALDRNISSMQRLCDESGLSLAPHVKTSMSPEIIARQMRAGAWAATVATPTQARTVQRLGVRRLLIANEVLDPAAIEWLGQQMDQHEDFTAYCYVDSVSGVDILDAHLDRRSQMRPLPVIVEFGAMGGRGGVRSRDDALRLAGLVRESRHLVLAGIGGFEGSLGEGCGPDRLELVRDFLERMRVVADDVFEALGRRDHEFVVTAGGSAFFELVRDVFDQDWRGGRPIRVVLRSGCYVTHDSVVYEEFRSLMSLRCEPLELTPSLELWSRVLSRPEPDLAILDFGKRDTSSDAGFPRPQHVLRRGSTTVEPAPPAVVVELNDQHAYLKSAPSAPATGTRELEAGDLIGLGISHPCTTLDKWRLIPVVDRDRRLIAAAQTLF